MRDQYLLEDDVVFLNHGSYGACPRPVFESYQYWQLETERQPVTFFGRRRHDLLENVRNELGGFLKTSGDNLLLVTNATSGVNTVARCLELQPGDEILMTDHEYGAICMTWQYYADKLEAVVVEQPITVPLTTPEEFIESFWQGVTDRTRVIAISHITSPTALILPIEAICKRAREADILTVIDGAHAPGQIDVDLHTIDPDFYSGNCHKWLSTPKGAAFVYVRPELQVQIDPLVISWGSGKENAFVDRHEWQGTRDLAAFLSIPAAIKFQSDHNWPSVRARCHDLLCKTRKRIELLGDMAQVAPAGRVWNSQMGSISLPMIEYDAYKRLFPDFNIEVPIFPWKDHILMRLSVQAYNSQSDMDKLVDALTQVIAETTEADERL